MIYFLACKLTYDIINLFLLLNSLRYFSTFVVLGEIKELILLFFEYSFIELLVFKGYWKVLGFGTRLWSRIDRDHDHGSDDVIVIGDFLFRELSYAISLHEHGGVKAWEPFHSWIQPVFEGGNSSIVCRR